MITSIKRFLLKSKEDDTISFLGNGMVISFGAQGIGFIFSTLLHIYLARNAGPENYGIYSYAVSWVLIFAMISKFGFGTSLLKNIARYESKENWGALKGMVISSYKYPLLVNGLLLIASVPVLFLMKTRMGTALFYALMISLILGMLMTHLQISASTLLGLRKVLLSKLVTPVLRPFLLFIIAFSALTVTGGKLTGMKIILFDISAHSVLLLLSFFFIYKSLPGNTLNSDPVFHNREWLKIAFPLFIYSLLNAVIRQTDVLMLGILTGVKEVGIYSAALKLCFVVSFSLNATTSVVAPMISRYYSLGKKEEIKKIFRVSRILLGIISVPVSVIIFIFSDFFLGFFGAPFLSGKPALKILLVGKLINVVAGPIGFLFTMTGHHMDALKVVGISAGMNIVLNFILINFWGMTGAAIASSFSLIFWNITLILLSRKKFGFSFF